VPDDAERRARARTAARKLGIEADYDAALRTVAAQRRLEAELERLLGVPDAERLVREGRMGAAPHFAPPGQSPPAERRNPAPPVLWEAMEGVLDPSGRRRWF
jgi:hypothetical protein